MASKTQPNQTSSTELAPLISWIVALIGAVSWVLVVRNGLTGGQVPSSINLIAGVCFLAWAVGSIVALTFAIGSIIRSVRAHNGKSTAINAVVILLTLGTAVAFLYFMLALSLL